MKFLHHIFTIIFLSLTSCSNSEKELPSTDGTITLECKPVAIEAQAIEAEYPITVNCSSKEWTAYTSDDCNDWITTKITNQSSENGIITITVKANTTTNSRQGTIIVKSGQTRTSVQVNQKYPLQISSNELFSTSNSETFTVEIISSDDWSVETSDNWITTKKIDSKALTVTTLTNDIKQSRTGVITITSGPEQAKISVYQESAEDRDIKTPEGYRLVWHDEFNEGTKLNSEWTHEVQGPGWVNNELQTYVNEQANGKYVTELVDGKLNINCFKGSDGKIYSGRVYAKVNTGWLYGYFEARIMLPKGKGTWPAFWMMPVNNDYGSNPWPKCGEIDIMEEVGADANIVSSSIHCAAYNHPMNTQKTANRNIGTAESEYHVYACEWTEDYIRFFVDDEELMTFYNEGTGRDVWPFTYAFYPILNLAWGGDWGGYKGVDESALPVTMKVDYIRIFQKK